MIFDFWAGVFYTVWAQKIYHVTDELSFVVLFTTTAKNPSFLHTTALFRPLKCLLITLFIFSKDKYSLHKRNLHSWKFCSTLCMKEECKKLILGIKNLLFIMYCSDTQNADAEPQ